MINLLKLLTITSVATFGIANATVYTNTQSDGNYTVTQTCQVTDADKPLAEYNAEVSKGGTPVGNASYELAVSAYCKEFFKDIDDQLFKNLM